MQRALDYILVAALVFLILEAAIRYWPREEPRPGGETSVRSSDMAPPVPREFQRFPPEEAVYQSRGVFTPEEATVSLWTYFESGVQRGDHVFFHTDDSRFALHLDTAHLVRPGPLRTRVVARAGGNQRASDTSGPNVFPEASAMLESPTPQPGVWVPSVPFRENAWHFVAMTWKGYPAGSVSLYIDGALVGRTTYDERFSDGAPLFETFSIGFRPSRGSALGVDLPSEEWIVIGLAAGGIRWKDFRIYSSALREEEIRELYDLGSDDSNGG